MPWQDSCSGEAEYTSSSASVSGLRTAAHRGVIKVEKIAASETRGCNAAADELMRGRSVSKQGLHAASSWRHRTSAGHTMLGASVEEAVGGRVGVVVGDSDVVVGCAVTAVLPLLLLTPKSSPIKTPTLDTEAVPGDLEVWNTPAAQAREQGGR
jgi:hypothetical protein